MHETINPVFWKNKKNILIWSPAEDFPRMLSVKDLFRISIKPAKLQCYV